MKFPIKDFWNKCDQIHRNLQIWSHLLKKSLMENFIFLCSERIRGVLKTLSSIYVEFFCENSYIFLAVKFMRGKVPSDIC